MALKWVKLSWLIRLAVKVFVRWLISQLLEELKEGILLKVTIEGRTYWLLIQLQAGEVRMGGRIVVDGD